MKILKILIPKRIRSLVNATRIYFYDIKAYVKYSNSGTLLDNQKKFNGYLTLLYHVIEKGLTMPEPRLGFGENVVRELIDLCYTYIKQNYDPNSLAYVHSIKVLIEYKEFHEKHNFKMNEELYNKIKDLSNVLHITESSSQKEFTKNEFFKETEASFETFCKSRHTLRNFSDENVPVDEILKCIELANLSPSACNRQPTRVHIVNNPELVKNSLKYQTGNRGFGPLINTLLVVTSDISAFRSYNERNEPYFNAGLFSMTLVYALHYHKIGTCMLNWSASKENDIALRKLLNIPDNEKVTVMIGCGYPPDKFKIANSPRLDKENLANVV